MGDESHGVGGGDLEGLQRTGHRGAADRGDEERPACGRVLHEGVFRDGGGVPRGGVELPALALPSASDAAERIPQTFDDEGGSVRRRSDLGAERKGCGGAVFRELGRTQKTHPADRTGIENGKLNRAAFGPTANPRGETERVGLWGMLDLSGLSARKIHFKSWIRVKACLG